MTDLERSVLFYERVLGARREWTIDVPAGASAQTPDHSYTVTMLALPGVRIELFQFAVEGERRYDGPPRTSAARTCAWSWTTCRAPMPASWPPAWTSCSHRRRAAEGR